MRRRIDPPRLLALALILGVSTSGRADEPRQNYFDDPFVQLTHGIANCPTPAGPEITAAQMRSESHSRADRGGSCYRSGRCRLSNSYLYDKEIMPRVQLTVDSDGRFASRSSVWAEGQRRWVWLKGCVRSEKDAAELERIVRDIDDVEAVVNELKVLPPSP